jgi:hypothetical protein
MSKLPRNANYKSVTAHLTPELAFQFDRLMIDFGVESKSAMLGIIIESFMAMNPESSTVHLIAQQAVKEMRTNEFESLANYYEQRAKLMRAGMMP